MDPVRVRERLIVEQQEAENKTETMLKELCAHGLTA
jgi:hypothetical protein